MAPKTMDKVTSLESALSVVRDGMTILVGGFGERGFPFTLVDQLRKTGVKDITLIKSDANETGIGVGNLVRDRLVKKIICSHCGLNQDVTQKSRRGDMELEIIPQGILAEKIRAGGSGIPAFLTDIGLETILAQGKPRIEFKGSPYLIEEALRGDVALLKAHQGDRFGNLTYKQVGRNFNPLMAMAADVVIVEVEEILEPGEIDPDQVVTPGIFVDMLVRVPAMTRAEAIGRGM